MSDQPRSIEEYLEQLRQELAGADPALVQDHVDRMVDALFAEPAGS